MIYRPQSIADISAGYNLIIPNGPIHSPTENRLDENAYLIDMEGEVRHKWQNDAGLKYGVLLPNGNLLARTRAPESLDHDVPNFPGSSSALIEIDWDSNPVWIYEDKLLHHDFFRLQTGNTMFLAWDRIPVSIISNIKGGADVSLDKKLMYGDVLREVDSHGKVVWEWKSWEHLNFEHQVICPLENRSEWTHANSIYVMPDDNVLVSLRNTNMVIIIEKLTGDVIWEWGSSYLEHQHHATLLDPNKILVFDNCTHKNSGARVIVVDITSKRVVWEYSGLHNEEFTAPYAGSVDKLSNGNWLICQGSEGKAFEIDFAGNRLWEYASPYFIPNESGKLSNGLFRVHRYPLNYSAFEGKQLG